MRALGVLLLALLSAPFAVAQPPVAWFEDTIDFKSDTLIYGSPETLPRDPPPSLSRTRLYVPLIAPASGPAAFLITIRRDCATGQETSSYAEYAADGRESSPAPAVPMAVASFVFAHGVDIASWRDLCRSTRRPPAPGLISGAKDFVDPLRMITATSVAEAIDRAHALAPVVEEARQYKNTGNFELLVSKAMYGSPTFIVDARAREQVGDLTRLSFIEPRGGPWSRVTYLVNCQARTGKRELYADFDASGRINHVFGPTAEGAFDMLQYGDLLAQMCSWEPGASKNHFYLSDALKSVVIRR